MTVQIKLSDFERLSKQELVAITNQALKLKEARKSKTLESYLSTMHKGQEEFHKSQKRIRYFLGGNRSGKTTAGTVEMLWSCLGTHPFSRGKTPIKAALVAQDFETHVKAVLLPKILQWAPTGAIQKIENNQTGAARKIIFSNGSTIDVFSHDQDAKIFEGSDFSLFWCDEPMPKNIFTAMWRSCVDTGGRLYVTGTPIVQPWMYQEVMKATQTDDPLRWASFIKTLENAKNIGDGDAALGAKRIEEFASMLSPEERAARLDGQFLSMQGLIFKEWDRKHHLIPQFKWPQHWPIIETLDNHSQKPWAAAWIGITENNKKILLRSGLYEGVIEDIATQILEERTRIETSNGMPPRITRCLIDNSASVPLWSKSHTDPTARRVSVREELSNYISPPRVEVAPKNVRGKIDIFKQWLHISEGPKGLESEFYAFDIEENSRFVFEIEGYVWDVKKGGVISGLKDQPRKIDDDIIDAVLQVALTMPKDYLEPKEVIQTFSGLSTWKV